MINRCLFIIVSCISMLLAPLAYGAEECVRPHDETKIVECIEKGLFDPCESGGGSRSWMYAQCAYGHAEVAERQLNKLEAEISKRLNGKQHALALEQFQEAQRQWRKATESYCLFVNSADESGKFKASSEYLSAGFCIRRLKEQRVEELKPYVSSKTKP